MVNFGQYPLVYQLQNGLPVGLAETSSLGSFSAVNLVVSSITADNYLIGQNPASFNFTGVVAVLDATGTGISLVDNSNSNYPKIRPLTSNTNNFVTFSQNVNNVEINYGTNPLSYAHGGTNSVTTPYTNSVAYWNGSNQLITNSEFTFDESNLNIPTGGNYQIAGNQITLSDLANIDSPQTLENIPAPTTANTYLVYNGTGINWSAVTGTGGTSITIPTTPGRIPYVVNSTTLGEVGWLSIETGTGRFNVCNVYADGAVCAVVIQENGQTLSTKYQGKDLTLDSISNLSTGANQLLYFTNTDSAATATLTQQGRDLLDDNSFASMRTTLQLSALATKNQASLTTDVVGTLPIANGGTNKTSFNVDQLIFSNDFSQDSTLTFNKTTKVLYASAVSATNASANTFYENGQSLVFKYQLTGNYLTQAQGDALYQPCNVFLTTLSNQTTVNLASQVCGTLPILNGGTSKTSFNNDQLIYGQFSQDSNLTFISNSLRSPAVCATTVCATTFNEAGTNLSSKYLSITDAANTYTPLTVTGLFETTANAQNTYLTKSNFGTWSGALALSAGLLDVQITSPSPGQVLKWTGSNWINDTDATGTGGTTSPVGPEGAVQYRSGAGGFTGVGSFIFNQASALLATNSVSAGVFYAAGTGQIKTPKSNYVYYGSPAATTFGGVTYPKGYVTQDQNGEFWFSSNAVISGATQPGPSSTLFVRRVCVGGTQTTTNNIGVVFGRFATNPGIGPGYDPVDLDPPEFLTLTGTANYLTYMDSGGTLSYASAMSVYKKNGSLSSSPDTLQINGTLVTQILSSTIDATIDNDLVVLGNGQVLGTLEAGTVSATNYLNLPSSTITWLNAYNAQTIRKYVKNTTGSTIAKGRAVTVVGATGDNVLVATLSSVNTHVPEAIGFSNHVFGLTETQILNDDFGYIITEGILSGTGGGVNALDTSLFSAGDILYVSSNGLLSNTRPPAPYEAHPVGYVIRSQSNVGSIYVKVETVPEINDIVGFNLASSILNGDLITYDLTTSTFVNTQNINLSGSIKGGSVSATTVSATNYLNLPSVTALNGTGIFEVTSYSRTNFVLTSTNLELSNTVTGHIASAVHWDLTTLNNNYINASGDSVTGPFFFGTLSATTFSATNYRNLPTSALSGLSDTLITSPATSSVLKWNGTKWVAAPDQTGGGGGTPTGGQYAIQVDDGAGGFYGDTTVTYDYDAAKVFISTSNLQVDAIATFNNSTDFTQPVTFTTIRGTSVSSTTVSATTYLNLPSGVATWNANKLQGVTVTSTAPVATQHLEYDGTSWSPEWNSVSTINSTVTLTNICDEKLFVSSSGSKVTVTLPDPTTCAGKEIQLIKSDPSGMPVYVSATTLQSPGNLIAMRIPRDMVQVISNGTNWYIQHNNSSYGGSHEVGTYDVEFEDFIWGSTETGEVGIRNWSFTNGTVTVVNNTGADGTGRGVINRQSGTTANQVASMYPSNAGTNTTNFANEILDFKIRQYPTSIVAYKIRFGMFSDMTADPPASGIYFECSSGQSNYQAITRNGAVETKTDTGVAVDAAAFSTFRIFRRSDSAIEFYINDNAVATNTANIPSQHAITFGYQCIPTTTTAKGSNIDYLSVAIVDTTQRY